MAALSDIPRHCRPDDLFQVFLAISLELADDEIGSCLSGLMFVLASLFEPLLDKIEQVGRITDRDCNCRGVPI